MKLSTIEFLAELHRFDVPMIDLDAIHRMRERGIWLNQEVIRFALAH